jgi:capsular polysaccharide biosynthesis protein
MALLQGTPPASELTTARFPRDFGGPRTIGEAIGRHWWLPVLLAAWLGAAGAFVGYHRTPIYTTSAVLNAGRIDVQAQSISGYTQASAYLATTYSRVVGSGAVLAPVARRTGRPIDFVAANLSATPIPNSSVFRVQAKANSPQEAVTIANAAAAQIVRFAKSQTRGGHAAKLLAGYGAASARASRLASRAGAAKSQSGISAAQLADMRRAAAVAALEAQGLQQQYVQQVANLKGAAEVTLLSPARTASSDRTQKTEIGAFIGLVAGLLLGGLLALRLALRGRRLATSILGVPHEH